MLVTKISSNEVCLLLLNVRLSLPGRRPRKAELWAPSEIEKGADIAGAKITVINAGDRSAERHDHGGQRNLPGDRDSQRHLRSQGGSPGICHSRP